MSSKLLLSNRSVSPVIAVVLMVALTVLLVSVVAAGIFGEIKPIDSPPNLEATFEYSEANDLTKADSFGHTGQPDADGQVRVMVERLSSNVDAESLEVIVGGSEYNWAHHQTEHNVGETVDITDEINVWAEHNDTVMLVWEGPHRSDVLSTFSIGDFGSDRSIPAPDEDCSYVENQLTYNGPPDNPSNYEGDLTIDGVVVECDLDQYDVHNLEIINGGAVIGEVEADGNINIVDGATYEGDVETLNGGKLTLDSQSEINGDATVTGGADLYQDSTIHGNLDAGTDVNADGDSRIEGWLKTPGNVDLGGSGGATVSGKVTADGNINIHDGSTVQDDVESTNSGSVTLTDGTVLGVIATQGDVDVDSSTVENHIYVDGSFSCDSSQIHGDDCSTYTTKSYGGY